MNDLPPTEENEGLIDADVIFPVPIEEHVLHCCVGASHGSDPRKMRSITGTVFTYCGGAIAYRSKTQTVTATSSTEAELIAAYTAAKIARYLRQVLKQLGFEQTGPTTIHIDNQSALTIINDNVSPTDRT